MKSVDEFYQEFKSRIADEFNSYLENLSLNRLEDVIDEHNFIDCKELTLAVYPSVTSGETIAFRENKWELMTTIELFVNDSYSIESNRTAEKYLFAFLTWLTQNSFSEYDCVESAVLIRMNENADFNGFALELKSRINTDIDYF